MKKMVVVLILIVTLIGTFLIGIGDKVTIQDLSFDSSVLVKQQDTLQILYHGNSENVPLDIENREVVSIATSDDTDNTVCVFVK